MIKTSIALTIIHLVYYLYFLIVSDILTIGLIYNTKNKVIAELRTRYKVNIKTFQKNDNHYGFAGLKTIYLNESLFKKEKALRFAFHHEYFHLTHHHKAKVLLMRFTFALVPLLLIWHWLPAITVWVIYAYVMHIASEKFEKDANFYAEDQISN